MAKMELHFWNPKRQRYEQAGVAFVLNSFRCDTLALSGTVLRVYCDRPEDTPEIGDDARGRGITGDTVHEVITRVSGAEKGGK